MTFYLVGGAVRDRLLGLPVTERDYVVVGSTPAALEQQGFRRVGKDFPVFLHPVTQEEYALARVERKIAPGYQGFEFHTDPNVTLEEDLQRRDLTINAIAENEQGQLIDPYHGITDLQQKILRHVSPAFIEDPVRLLRVARFFARFATLGFTIAPETLLLMQKMVNNGEIEALVPERVWQETEKAFNTDQPGSYLKVLEQCGALAILFPTWAERWSVRSSFLMQQLHLARQQHLGADSIFSLITLELTDADGLRQMVKRYPVPHAYRDLAAMLCKIQLFFNSTTDHAAPAWLLLLKELDAFRRHERFRHCLEILPFTLHLGKNSNATKNDNRVLTTQLEQAFLAANSIQLSRLDLHCYLPKERQGIIEQARLNALEELLQGR